MRDQKIKRYLKWFGNVLSLLGVAFIVWQLFTYQGKLDLASAPRLIPAILACSLVYGAACALTALAWRESLLHVGASLDVRSALFVYGTSQLAKYVPGNVFHLASRQVQGLAIGLPGWALAKSMVWELVTLSVAAALFGTFLLPVLWPQAGRGIVASAFVFAVVLVAAMLSVLRHRRLAWAVLWNVAFMLINGGLFAMILWVLSPTAPDAWGLFFVAAPAYVVAWLGGFMTPGAPAGVGVREVIAYTLLQTWYAEPVVLVAVLASRVVSVLGDVWFYGLSLALKRFSKDPSLSSV